MLHRLIQSVRHRKTLQFYKTQKFLERNRSISVGKALQHGILEDRHLYGNSLLLAVATFDSIVWERWHRDSVLRKNAYLSFYDVDLPELKEKFGDMAARLMPYEQVAEQAVHGNRVELLDFLRTLKDPWEPWTLNPLKYLGASAQITDWVMQHVDIRSAFSDPYDFFERMLKPGLRKNYANGLLWMEEYLSAKTRLGYEENQVTQKQHALANVIGVLLRDAPWTQRWERLGPLLKPWVIDLDNNEERKARSLHGFFVGELLREAPLEVQIRLCAFRNLEHPREAEDATLQRDALAIRGYFFEHQDLPAGSAHVAAILALWNPEDVTNAEQWLMHEHGLSPLYAPQTIESFSLSSLG